MIYQNVQLDWTCYAITSLYKIQVFNNINWGKLKCYIRNEWDKLKKGSDLLYIVTNWDYDYYYGYY